MKINFNQVDAPLSGALYANGVSPIAEFVRRATRVFLGDSAGFTGATAGNNGTTHSFLADMGGKPAVGTWSAASGAFPATRPDLSPVQEGDMFQVIASGTVGGQAFIGGQKISALIAAPSTSIYTGNWSVCSTLQYYETAARMVVTSATLPVAFAAAANAPVGASANSFYLGGAFAARNNSGVSTVKAEAGYFDAVRARAGSGYTTGTEINITDVAGDMLAKLTPYSGLSLGMTFGQIIASGGGSDVNAVSYTATVAQSISNNGKDFWSGTVYGATALRTWDDGFKRAVLMPVNASVSWWASGNIEAASITCTTTTAADAQSIRFNSSGVSFLNDLGLPYFFLNNGPNSSAVNYLSISSAASGSNPRISWAGPDARTINMAGLPTSSTGLASGDLWSDGGTLKVA